jgi:hypothetical protein
MKDQGRYHGLDFVRAVAMMLGVVIHTCCFFRDDIISTWPAGDYHGDPLNTFTVKFIHFFRMQLFMLLAGFFAELVFQRKGMNYLMKDRIKRILLPFLIGIFLFVPIVMFLSNTTWVGGFTNVFDNTTTFDRAKSYLLWGTLQDKSVFNEFTLWHFWFIYFLLYFYLFHWLFHLLGKKDFVFGDNAILNKCIKSALSNKWGFLILGALAFPIHYSLQSPMFWPSQLNFQVNELIYYFGFYVFGAYLYKNISLLTILAKNCWFYLFISLPFVFILNEPTTRHDLMRSVVVDITSWKIANFQVLDEGIYANGFFKVTIVFLRCAVSWTLCLGFIGLAHRYLNKPNRSIRYLADSAYWVFWVHVLFTCFFSRYAQQFSFNNAMFKTVAVFHLILFCMYFLYNNCVRYTFLGDYFMGKRKDPTDPGEKDFSTFNITKKTIPFCLASLAVAFIWGYLYNKTVENDNRETLFASFIARDEGFLEKYNSLSGVEDRYGRNPLHVATINPESFRIYNPMPVLLEKNVDINERDFVGRTPLFYAVRTGNLKDAEFLIAKGADMTLADEYGHTPAHVAAIKTGSYDSKSSDLYFDILKSLMEKGADINARDYRGRTVLDCLEHFANRELN